MENAALGRQRFLGKNETDLTGLGTYSSATPVALSCTAILWLAPVLALLAMSAS
jgi:hypothetical protein